MTVTAEARYESIRSLLEKAGQDHVLAFWGGLSSEERDLLLSDIARCDVGRLAAWREAAVGGGSAGPAVQQVEPAPIISKNTVSSAIVDHGRELLARGKVAALTVAGGQGTRLGFDGPKGAFAISPVRNKPLFQLFGEQILATQRRYGAEIHWYVMTSPANDAATRAFFVERGFFGLAQGQVHCFQQGVMPAFGLDGRILLDQKHRLALSPDGHGGSLRALSESRMLADMTERGIAYISYFQVDNPLVTCMDPVFLGLHAERKSEMSSKVIPKAEDLERVGNFVLADGRLVVIEYSDLPMDVAHARNPDGSRRYDAANIAIHVLSRSFVEKLTADRAAFGLPWHVAKKMVPYFDVSTGNRVEPEEPNAIKLEAFIFDALPLAENPILLEASREEEFSPVKNATGVDSVESARRDMSLRAARWLEAAGTKIPRDGKGAPAGRFEISPLVALDAEELCRRARTENILPREPIRPGLHLYLGE